MRVPVSIDIEYGDGCPPIRRRTTNLAAGGVFVETQTPLPEGLPVRLRFSLPDDPRTLEVDAAVAWSEPDVGMGLRFTGIDDATRVAIRAYVARRLREVRRGGTGPGEPREEPPAVLAGSNGLAAVSVDGARLPAPPPEAGTLYLTLAVDEIRARVGRLLEELGAHFSEPYRDLLAIPLCRGLLPRLVGALRRVLSPAEIGRCRALVLTEGVGPSLADLMRMQPLGALVTLVEKGWLLTMLRDGRLLSVFQPIVHAGCPERVFGYEALVRGRERDGSIVGAARLFDTARSVDLLVHLDRIARLEAIRGAVAHRLETRLFLNVNPASIDDPRAHLEATMSALRDAGLDPSQVVFEVVESDEIRDPDGLRQLLDLYRAAGFGVALDDLGAGYSSLNALTLLRPDFVKLDMKLVRDVDGDAYRAEIVGKLLESARNLGIRTVAEGVETEGEWRWLTDHHVDFVQGYFFAEPGLPPPSPRTLPAATA